MRSISRENFFSKESESMGSHSWPGLFTGGSVFLFSNLKCEQHKTPSAGLVTQGLVRAMEFCDDCAHPRGRMTAKAW